MNILEILSEHAKRKSKPFLVVGGHSLTAYGVIRLTADLDLMVSKEDKDWWMGTLSELKLKCYQDTDAFARFSANELGIWPVDLMFILPDVFDKFLVESKTTQILQTNVLVPKITHIIALKLFAIKSNPEKRYSKDLLDIIQLIKKANPLIDLKEVKIFCEKYGPPLIYEQIEKEIT